MELGTTQVVDRCLSPGNRNRTWLIYIYCYNCDYRNFTTTEGIEDRITEFHKGIAMATEAKNELPTGL